VDHVFKPRLISAHRGVSEIAPALLLYGQLREYTSAVVQAAKTAAKLSGVIESTSDQLEPVELDELDQITFEIDMLMTLPAGWKVNQFKSEQPTTQYPDFKKQLVAEMARCLQVPLGFALADFSDYNYSGGQLDHGVFDKSNDIERYDFANAFCDKAFVRWLEEARRIKGFFTSKIPPVETIRREWFFDGAMHGDPVKDARAASERILNGTSNRWIENSRNGRDWRTLMRQEAVMERYRRELEKEFELTLSRHAPQPVSDEDMKDEEEDGKKKK
jgi:capsid protein